MSRNSFVIPTILLAAIVTALIFLPNAQAVSTTKYNIIAVEYSQSCQTMLDHSINNTCPTLDKIWKYDTSNKNISGKLLWNGKEFLRSNPQVMNHYIWYNTMTVCIACNVPLNNPDLFKTLFIEPSGFTYITKDQEIKNSHHWTSYSNTFISPDCMTATIGYSDYLLNDTIHYMLNNCTGQHHMNNQTNTIKDTPFDYNNPFSSLHLESYLKSIMHGHGTTISNHTSGGLGPSNCITHQCNYTDPYKKLKWG